MKLLDFCKTGAGGTPLKSNKAFYDDGDIPWLLSGEVANKEITVTKNFITELGLEKSSAKLFPKDTVVVAMYGATAGEVGILKCEASTNQAVCGIYPNDRYIPEYLYYFLLSFKSSLISQAVGNAQPNISQQKIKNIDVPLPAIDIQQKIVTKLDAAFADIDNAKQKAEQNLKNAHELFNSYLQSVFGQKDDGWVEKPFDQVCVLQRGFDLPKRLREPGDYPLVTSSGIKDTHKEAKVSGPGVVTGRSGSIGNVYYVEDNFWPLNTALYIKNFHNNNEKYIYWFLRYFDLSRFSGGTGVPTLNRNLVHGEMVFVLEDTNHQANIVSRIESLEQEVRQLDVIYKKKIKALEELKQSILKKAFSGEL